MKNGKPIILFGAGKYGKIALDYFGREAVYCFVDNNKVLEGTLIKGVPVISFARLKEIYPDYELVISTGMEALFSIIAQVKEAKIYHYQIFMKILAEKNHKQTVSELPHPDAVGKTCCVSEGADDCRRVLMAAYFFPPLSGSGVFRSIKFAKYLPQFGWQPTILSTDQPPVEINYMDESLLDEIPKGMDVIRIPDYIQTARKTSFSDDTEKALLQFLKDVLKPSETAMDLFNAFLQTKAEKAQLLTFPCSSLLWAYDVIQYIEENIDLSKFQVLYTTSTPYSAHLIGLYFKRKYGIPWVADYRDPWTENAYFLYNARSTRDRLLFELESILLREADHNIWVEEHIAKSHVEHFGLLQSKASGITNGYDESDFADLPCPNDQPSKFTINYSGILYTSNRSIEPILKALQELVASQEMERSNIHFRVVGDADQSSGLNLIESYGLKPIAEQTGYLSHEEALLSNYSANILLLLLGDSDQLKYAYTGKIFDYLRSGRPVLALAPPEGVVDKILRESGHGEAFLSTDIPGIKAMILREYRKWQRGEKRELLHSPLIEQFERKRLTGQLANILSAVSC